jgi:hypothetical protein
VSVDEGEAGLFDCSFVSAPPLLLIYGLQLQCCMVHRMAGEARFFANMF